MKGQRVGVCVCVCVFMVVAVEYAKRGKRYWKSVLGVYVSA